MPRPRVPLENRKRALQACTQCRSSKKRCNGSQPCTNCNRRGVGQSCTFEDTQAPGEINEVNRDSVQSPRMDSYRSGLQNSRHSRRRSTVTSTPGTLASSPEAAHRTRPRLLDTSHGEKAFIGGSASLAFLQLVRDTVSQNMGKSTFSHHEERNHMLEGPRAHAVPIEEVALSLEQESAYLDAFLVATQGLLELHSKAQLVDVLNRHRVGDSSSKSLPVAAAHTSLAIGAQCSLQNSQNVKISQSYFAEAQRQAFAGMIEDPSLDMVELFLLMSFYMLGACHRNAAFMYIGVAARSAYALGLHYEYRGNKSATRSTRTRAKVVWKSLVTLDTIVSSILGRPAATATQLNMSLDDNAMNSDTVSGPSVPMQANYELACLLDQKVQQLYNAEKVTVEGAKACLDQLGSWSSRLPSGVRAASSTIQNDDAKKRVIGSLHVSCFYYFAVMLVTRPFLVVHLSNRLTQNRTKPPTLSFDEYDEVEMQDIANACLNAATYMVQICLETQSHGLLPNNMRLLKAWVFAAGLVLGFEMFTVSRSEAVVEEAFSGSCDVLKALSVHSIQAAHYHEILTSLADAINARRRQTSMGAQVTKKPMVERIMAFAVQDPDQETTDTTPSVTQSTENVPATAISDVRVINELWLPTFESDINFGDMINDPFSNWDNADFLAWDPFSNSSQIGTLAAPYVNTAMNS